MEMIVYLKPLVGLKLPIQFAIQLQFKAANSSSTMVIRGEMDVNMMMNMLEMNKEFIFFKYKLILLLAYFSNYLYTIIYIIKLFQQELIASM